MDEENTLPQMKQNLPDGKEKKKKEKTDAFDWVQCIVTALVVCILLFVFVGRSVGVIGNSMVPTLSWGDRLIVSSLFYTPKQGDIVILRKQTLTPEPIVKRIIATEGQTVNIDYDTGTVYIDGEALNETQFGIENGITFHPYDGYEALVFPQTVPKGCVFVLGDNRTVSSDSRYAEIGMIDTRHIMGEAVFTLYPFDRFGFVKTNENN